MLWFSNLFAVVQSFLVGYVVPVVIAVTAIGLFQLLSFLIQSEWNSALPRGKFAVPAKIPGPGVTFRNAKYLGFLETPFEGGNTLAAIFKIAAKRHKHRNLLGTRTLIAREFESDKKSGRTFEKLTLGAYQWETYGQVYERVVHFAQGLARSGHAKGEMLAIFAETRAEWFIAMQSCFIQNFPLVTVYSSLGDDALVHSLNETEATSVVCDPRLLSKVLSLSPSLPFVKRIIGMPEQDGSDTKPHFEKWKSSKKEGEGEDERDKGRGEGEEGGETGGQGEARIKEELSFFTFAEVEVLGMEKEEGKKEGEREREEKYSLNFPKPNDLAVVMYTSGTTGMPKGVMITHYNLVATLSSVLSLVPDASQNDVYLGYLPLAHVLELAAQNAMLCIGASVGFGSPLTLTSKSPKIKQRKDGERGKGRAGEEGRVKGDAEELRPTLFAAVPAIMDRIREGVNRVIDSKGNRVGSLFDLAFRRRVRYLEGKLSGSWGIEYWVASQLLFKPIRAMMGGNLRYVLSGGAPLSPDTQRFMNVVFGCPVGQGYGLTETCAGGTFSHWEDKSVGKVGPPIPCCLIRLVDWPEGNYLASDLPFPRGEIVIGGSCVSLGYWRNDEKTRESFVTDERGIRWFYTGDVGQIHSDGCLEIIDRKKDIVKLQHGEYISLGKVESVLLSSPFVDSLLVHANPLKSFAVALVVLNLRQVDEWARDTCHPLVERDKQRGTEGEKGEEDRANLYEALCQDEALKIAVMKSLKEVASGASLHRFEIPDRILLLWQPWTPESGLVTSALKVKRQIIIKAFAKELDALYG